MLNLLWHFIRPKYPCQYYNHRWMSPTAPPLPKYSRAETIHRLGVKITLLRKAQYACKEDNYMREVWKDKADALCRRRNLIIICDIE